RVLQSLVDVSLAAAIDQRLEAADARRDVAQLAGRHRFLAEVDDVRFHAALLEKALGSARFVAFLRAEELDGQCHVGPCEDIRRFFTPETSEKQQMRNVGPGHSPNPKDST